VRKPLIAMLSACPTRACPAREAKHLGARSPGFFIPFVMLSVLVGIQNDMSWAASEPGQKGDSMPATKPMSQTERLKWFHQAGFGMFIHWGIYSIPGRGEWVMHVEKIPQDEYAQFARRFKPRNYDPDEWVALAREAGMKYMVLTSRHHDGFSLFDSKVSDFTSAKAAAGRDLIGEYVAACRKAGMKVGFYYSLLDWRWPEYWAGPEKDPKGWARFLDYVHAQVRELCTNYGKIDVLWYDGGWPHNAEAWQSKKLNAMVRQLQPHIVINNRSQLPEDFDTPEQHIAFSQQDRAWETCMTMNDNWGYSAGDHNWKSTTQLIHNLVRCASGAGNFLLNVGPKPDGTIPEPSVKRLKEIGAWMKVNGESIYGCGRCPFGGGMVGLTTAKGNTGYLHVFRWPGEELCIAGVKVKVSSARLLATGQRARIVQKDDRLFLLGLPRKAPDPHDSLIALKLAGPR
jgi:alpha-L-fucosidase